ETYRALDGVSAAEFLDRLKFPDRARHLALEVFARSFFAHPSDFSAGELVAMFHSYFLGSSEGLLFDDPRDDFDTALWRPLGDVLERAGMRRITGHATGFDYDAASERWTTTLSDGEQLEADAVVLAAGPVGARELVAEAAAPTGAEGWDSWRNEVARLRIAPPFAVLRLWLDGTVHPDRPAFLGTAGFGPLDNISVLERFEAGARVWSREHGGSVVELHAYAIPETFSGAGGPEQEALERDLSARLREELNRVYPEAAQLGVIAEELLIERDCALVGTHSWNQRPEVTT